MRSARLAGVGLRARAGRGPAVRTREIFPDGEAAFPGAPGANEGAVTGIGQRLAMQSDCQGVWWATTEPLQPNLHTYPFSVDGAKLDHPGKRLFKSSYGSAGQFAGR